MIPAVTFDEMRNLGLVPTRVRVAGLMALLTGLGVIDSTLTANAAEAPAQGSFLVATRDLGESWFSQTVILLVQHDELGTMGLVINQPSEIQLTEMLPEISHLADSDRKLYIGGPVASYGVTFLIQSDHPLEDAEHVFGDVYASGNRELLIDMLYEDDSATHIRLYAGHSGWSPGQLDGEIARGSWDVIPADESLIFSAEAAKIWRQLAPPQRRVIVRLNQQPQTTGAGLH
jgi:putative transcriptional regulator